MNTSAAPTTGVIVTSGGLYLVAFLETRFKGVHVYTNTGRRIAGQTICHLIPLDEARLEAMDWDSLHDLMDGGYWTGVTSLSASDHEAGLFSFYEGRYGAFKRAISGLSKSEHKELRRAFLDDARLNGSILDDPTAEWAPSLAQMRRWDKEVS